MSIQPGVGERLLRIVLRMLPFATAPEILDLVRDLQKDRSELAQQVDRTVAALTEAGRLVSDLETALLERQATVQALQAEYQRLSELASIEEGKARALLAELQQRLDHGKWTERLISLGVNLLAGAVLFIVGVVVSPWLHRVLGIGS